MYYIGVDLGGTNIAAGIVMTMVRSFIRTVFQQEETEGESGNS